MNREREIFGVANTYIREHGEDAVIEAAMRADALLDVGDLDGQRVTEVPISVSFVGALSSHVKLVLSITAVITVAVFLVLDGIGIAKAQSGDLPEISSKQLPHQERVAAFVSTFIKLDPMARELLNPSNRTLFAEGYRPKIGIPHDPEANGRTFSDIQAYFTSKLYLDLQGVTPLNQSSFQSFTDQVGRWADQTVICAGELSIEYNLNVENRFIFKTEVAKVPAGVEREKFKRCWLNDFILGTELRMLAWIHWQLFGALYVSPEKR